MSSYGKEYARFVVDLRYENIPSDVVHHTKNTILDTIGLGLSGIHTEEWKRTMAAVKDCMPGREATVWGEGSKASLLGATLVNEMGVNALEYEVATPPGYFVASTLIPAAIAVAEKEGGVGGKQLVESFVAGSEIMNRIGFAVSHTLVRKRGWNHTGIAGPFAAAATVAKLLKLDLDQVAWALGLAGAQSSGTFAWLAESDMSKRFMATKVGLYGVISAYLAKGGFTGSTVILEAEDGGFLRTYVGEWDASKITYGLGQEFLTKYNKPKMYPCCRNNHTPIDATLGIIRKHDISPDKVAKILVDIYNTAYVNVGKIKRPKTVLEAQFSVAYILAATITDKELTRRQFTLEKIRDPNILKLAEKVETRVDPEIEKSYGVEMPFRRMPCKVTIKMNDGREFSEVRIFERGTPVKNPATDEEIYQKYIDEATQTLPRDKAVELAAMIQALEEIRDIRDIVAKLGK
jgi:2-methylcitrate dehydratase PrpD